MIRRVTTLVRARPLLLATVFALPSCITSTLWRDTLPRLPGEHHDVPVTATPAELRHGCFRLQLTTEAATMLRQAGVILSADAAVLRIRMRERDQACYLERRQEHRLNPPRLEFEAGCDVCWFSTWPLGVDGRRDECRIEPVVEPSGTAEPVLCSITLCVYERPVHAGRVALAILATPFTFVLDVVLSPIELCLYLVYLHSG